MPLQRKSRWVAQTIVVLLIVTVLVAVGIAYVRDSYRGLPYHDSFATGQSGEWIAYGGAWNLMRQGIENDSNEPGAKLVTGSPYWKDYRLDADVQLMGGGDAGVILRAHNEEAGVDSYSGYYAGVRTGDQSVVLGRADHGWIEFPPQAMPGGIAPYHWYHLKVTASGCTIGMTVTSLDTGDTTKISHTDAQCQATGGIGLRSVSAGGKWRNISVLPLDAADLPLAPLPAAPQRDVLFPTDQGQLGANRVAGDTTRAIASGSIPKTVQSIRNLRFFSDTHPEKATVRGTVVLTIPKIYLQDSSGGTEVELASGNPLKVGDEVEVSGTVYPHGLNTVIRDAQVRPIWEWAPIPALSITTAQAATGAFNGMWIEVEGRLYEKRLGEGGPLMLKLSAGQQDFIAITSSVGSERLLHNLPLNSLLRLRGICTVDPAFTHNTVPFVLILRSIGDAKMVAGPPWWSADHIAGIGAGLLAAGFILYVAYARAKDWKLRVVMAERENLSHEMHDMLSQCFAGIGFQLRGILHRLQSQPSVAEMDSLRQDVSVAYGFVKRSHDVSRASLGSFYPEALESAGLIPALEQCARRLVTAGGVEVEATVTGDVRPLPIHILDSLYRIGQEALSNAVQHAHPGCIRIHAHYLARSIRLTIDDNGKGFNTHERSNGLGLNGMKLRAEDIKAKLEIRSETGRGTQIAATASIPSRRTWLTRLAYSERQD